MNKYKIRCKECGNDSFSFVENGYVRYHVDINGLGIIILNHKEGERESVYVCTKCGNEEYNDEAIVVECDDDGNIIEYLDGDIVEDIYAVDVYFVENNEVPDLCIDGKLPVVKCPKCGTELYAGSKDTTIPAFACSECGTLLIAIFLTET